MPSTVAVETIRDDTSPQNTPSWDSLNAIVLITEIEKAYGVTFAYAEAMGVKNFGDAVSLIRGKGVDLHD
jgi:acyl carrier protein